MDYQELACSLLQAKMEFIKIPASRQMSEMVKGEQFVLNYLSTHEGITHPTDLSVDMAVSTARIASLLNHMEEKQLIIRQEDPEDSRKIRITLTEKGRDVIARKRQEVIDHWARILEQLGPEDAREYLRIQKKLNEMGTKDRV